VSIKKALELDFSLSWLFILDFGPPSLFFIIFTWIQNTNFWSKVLKRD